MSVKRSGYKKAPDKREKTRRQVLKIAVVRGEKSQRGERGRKTKSGGERQKDQERKREADGDFSLIIK